MTISEDQRLEIQHDSSTMKRHHPAHARLLRTTENLVSGLFDRGIPPEDWEAQIAEDSSLDALSRSLAHKWISAYASSNRSSAPALSNRAWRLLLPSEASASEVAEGLALARRAFLFDPRDVEHSKVLSLAYLRAGHYQQAIELAEKSIDQRKGGHQPVIAADYAILSMAFWRLGQEQEALQALEQMGQEGLSDIGDELLVSEADDLVVDTGKN